MGSVIYFSPNTIQFTYQKEFSQEKDYCFSNEVENNHLVPEISFSEKYVSGFLNILSLISTGDIIYFTLPNEFSSTCTAQFLYDLIAACNYNIPSCIIFDRTRCSYENGAGYETVAFCDDLEQLFENTNLPFLSLSATSQEGSGFKISESSKSNSFHFKELEANLFVLKSLSNKIFDLKKSATDSKHVANNNSLHEKIKSNHKYHYTLN